MDFENFKTETEDLVEELFHGALGLGNNEHFRDLIGDGTGDDTKLFWEEGLQKIFNKIKE